MQLTTDGHAAYLDAVELAFGENVDYAQVYKEYGKDTSEPSHRYSPAKCTSIERKTHHRVSPRRSSQHELRGAAEPHDADGMRRFTRLTNAFSKKVENLAAAVSLHFMHYNFARVHKSLGGITPAMAAGVTDHVWSLIEIAALLDSPLVEGQA